MRQLDEFKLEQDFYNLNNLNAKNDKIQHGINNTNINWFPNSGLNETNLNSDMRIDNPDNV